MAFVVVAAVLPAVVLVPGRVDAQSGDVRSGELSRYQEAVERTASLQEYLESETSQGDKQIEIANAAIENCDQSKFDDAMEEIGYLQAELEGLLDQVIYQTVLMGNMNEELELKIIGYKADADNSIQYGNAQAARADEALAGLLTGQQSEVKVALDDLTALRRAVSQALDLVRQAQLDLKKRWQEKCSKPSAAVQPGAEVAKSDIVLVDEKTQQHIGGGQVFIIPQDPKQPIPPPIPVRPDGHITIPKTQPGDRVVFIPECHQKMVLDGASVGNGGAQIGIRPKSLRLEFNDIDCDHVGDELINPALRDQYGVSLPLDVGVPRVPPVVETEGGTVVDASGQVHPFCVVTVNWYTPVKPQDDKQACAVPTEARTGGDAPGPTRPSDGRSIPKDGETTINDGGRTVIVDGNQPREIQGPPPNDPYATSRGTWGQAYPDQWYLKAIRWLKDDGTTVLPDKGRLVTVAVIDTGVDFSHPDLAGANWRNPTPSDRHDVSGWNFVDDNADLRDLNGHGTVIAGIIAAETGNKLGIAGINPWARIMAIKAMDLDGRGGSINVARAIVYAAEHGARVINLSVGGRTPTRAEQLAIDYAAQKGALVVVASGNQGIDTANYSPSGLKNVLAVAAVGPDLKRQSFSNWGATIAIAAPGVDILSLRARQTDLLQVARTDYKPGTAVVGDRYYRVTGSSFAAPMVSGAASLLMSARPELTAAQVKRLLLQAARDIDGIGTNQFDGYGLLDIEAALTADPKTYVEAAITGVAAAQVGGRTVLRIAGTADADSFKEAQVEIGQGDNPRQWKPASRPITRTVTNGVLADLPPDAFRGSKQWTLRIIVTHRNGKKREARFKLTLG